MYNICIFFYKRCIFAKANVTSILSIYKIQAGIETIKQRESEIWQQSEREGGRQFRLTSVLTPFGNQSKNAVWQSATVGIGNDENETREYDLFEIYHRKKRNEERSKSEARKDILGLKWPVLPGLTHWVVRFFARLTLIGQTNEISDVRHGHGPIKAPATARGRHPERDRRDIADWPDP